MPEATRFEKGAAILEQVFGFDPSASLDSTLATPTPPETSPPRA